MGIKLLRGIILSVLLILFGAISSWASGSADSTVSFFSDSARTDVNLFWQTIKVLFALGLTLVIVVIVLVVLKRIIRFKNITGVAGGAIQVLEIQHIDPKKAVALVRVLDKVMIVGCSENSLSNLGELAYDDIERLNIKEHSDPGVFKTILARFTSADRRKPADTGLDAGAE